MRRKKSGVKLFPQMNGFKVMVKTWERKQFSGTPCSIKDLVSSIRVQVDRGESTFMLFETFSLGFFFTRANPRGARTPKNNFLYN